MKVTTKFMTDILPDVLDYNLNLIICGTAVGNNSAANKAYYAGKGNVFYQTLNTCGFTPILLNPKEYSKLVNYKIGLTDLAKKAKGMDSTLVQEDYDIDSFVKKILKYKPKVVCFNGKESARIFFKLKNTKEVSLGLQNETIGQTQIFVAPSTSPTAKRYWDENFWLELKNITFK